METKVPTSLIEKKSINKLEEILLNTGRIDPHFVSNNTMISWDGDIFLYDSKEKFGQKDSAGRIAVQIKGTTVKEYIKGNRLSFPVSVADLENYGRNGGCIYFVIYQSIEKPIIYYNVFLPFDLENILKKIKKQQETGKRKEGGNKTLYFEKFPTDEKAILALMKLFVDERTKQVSTARFTFDIKSPDSKAKELLLSSFEKGFAPFSFTLRGTPQNPFENSFDIPTYIYANTAIGIQIPIQRIHMEKVSMRDLPYSVFVNGVKHYNSVSISSSKDTEELILGKSIAIELVNPETIREPKISFSESGSLLERIKDYEVWLTICSNPNCKIICPNVLEGSCNTNYTADDIADIENRLNYLRSIQKAFDFFGITDELDLDNLSEKEQSDLNVLISVSKNPDLPVPVKNASMISNVKIRNVNIAILTKDLGNGNYKISNFFGDHDFNCIIDIEDRKCTASPFLIMRKQSMIECSNINYQVIFESIIKMRSSPYKVKQAITHNINHARSAPVN